MSQFKIKRVVVGLLETNCYLLVSEGEILVIDPGAQPEKILKEIKKTNAKAKYIITTHSHFDHRGAQKIIQKNTGALILKPKEGEKIKIGNVLLEVIETPGHSKDSICLLGKNFIFVGDLIFKEGIGRTDLFGGSEVELKKSLKRLKKLIKPEMKVFPGHGPIFLGKEIYV